MTPYETRFYLESRLVSISADEGDDDDGDDEDRISIRFNFSLTNAPAEIKKLD